MHLWHSLKSSPAIVTPSLDHIQLPTDRSTVAGFKAPRSRQHTSAAAEKVLSTAQEAPHIAR